MLPEIKAETPLTHKQHAGHWPSPLPGAQEGYPSFLHVSDLLLSLDGFCIKELLPDGFSSCLKEVSSLLPPDNISPAADSYPGTLTRTWLQVLYLPVHRKSKTLPSLFALSDLAAISASHRQGKVFISQQAENKAHRKKSEKNRGHKQKAIRTSKLHAPES